MDIIKLKKKYSNKLAYIGGICNTKILPSGDKKNIESHVRPILEIGRYGGVIIGTASIGKDISVESYEYYQDLIERYGCYEK